MIKNYADSLLKFLGDSPCNFFAVDTIRRMLDENGFHELRIADDWNLALGGGRYYVVKNDSAIFAFTMGKKPISETGVKVIANCKADFEVYWGQTLCNVLRALHSLRFNPDKNNY